MWLLSVSGGTRTDRALRLAERELFCPSCTRPGKPKVLLVITDGNTNPGSEDLTVASQTMKVCLSYFWGRVDFPPVGFSLICKQPNISSGKQNNL